MKIAEGVHVFERPQRGRGFDLPSRATALELERGVYALVSPIDFTLLGPGAAQKDEQIKELRSLGEIRYLIAPNLLHHLHLEAALKRFPEARVVAPRGLEKKQPALKGRYLLIDEEIDEPSLEWIALEGAPSVAEWAIFHRPSRSLVLTDIVFHILEPRGFINGLILRAGGTYQKLASSRLFASAVKDKAAMRRSLERLFAVPAERVIVAHGECLEGEDAMPRLEAALRARYF